MDVSAGNCRVTSRVPPVPGAATVRTSRASGCPVTGVDDASPAGRDTVEQRHVKRQLATRRIEQPHGRDVVRLARSGPGGIGATAGDGAAAGGQCGAENCEQQRGAHDGFNLHSGP